MKKIATDDIIKASERVSLQTSAKAALVLYAAEVFLKAKIGSEANFFWRPMMWKGGVLKIEVDHPAAALRIYTESEELLRHLRENFPDYVFREVRTEIVSRRNQR